MTFAPMFRELHACTFAERSFEVDTSTLHDLALVYPLPEKLNDSVLKRQVEFLAGRVCAKQAIKALIGHTPETIPAQSDRAPGWPPGIVGSITHTARYAAALVASDTHYHGMGIDCEAIISPDNLNLQKHICVANELEALHEAYSDWAPEELLTLVFSAKESLFKCLYRQTRKFFGFSAARVTALDATNATFIIQLEHDLTPHLQTHAQWSGQFQRQDALLMTAILYPRNP